MGYNERIEGYEPEIREPDMRYDGRFTAADYLTWKTEELLELIRGKIYRMSPAPLTSHQIVFGNLHSQIIKNGDLKEGYRVWLAPVDVYFIHPGEDFRATQNVMQPDLFINCDPSKIHRRGCMGAPDFVVEILSPGTRKKDATLKHEIYEEYGVREYWMISLTERMILVNLLNEQGKFETQKPVVEGEIIAPRDFPNLTIDLEKLFQDLSEEED